MTWLQVGQEHWLHLCPGFMLTAWRDTSSPAYRASLLGNPLEERFETLEQAKAGAEKAARQLIKIVTRSLDE